MKKFLAIIPARYASTRFPGKPLALLGGKPIVQRVYERVNRVFEHTVVATDDQRIFDCVEEFGGKAVMTSTNHKSGTDRCFEALNKSGVEADVVVNVQGDEPFIAASQLESIKRCFEDDNTDIATLVQPFTPSDGIGALQNPNSPKVVVSADTRSTSTSDSMPTASLRLKKSPPCRKACWKKRSLWSSCAGLKPVCASRWATPT